MRGASPIASVGTRNDPFAPVGTGGGVGARSADVDELALPPSGTVVSAACFCVVSLEGSASGGIDVRGSSPISLASTVGIDTRSAGRLSSTITDGSAAFSFDATGAAAMLDAVPSMLGAWLSLCSLVAGELFVSLAAGASDFAGVVDAGAIGFAFATGAAAFIGSVRPRNGETVGAGAAAGAAVVADPDGAIGRAPGNGTETFDGVRRCGEGPGFAADATFAKIGATGAAGFDAAL